MDRAIPAPHLSRRPSPGAVLELFKPITWFPPMWAFACGVVSSGQPVLDNMALLAAGVLLAGPLICASSQAVNDWYDRHVDAINQPERPIPSGRVPGRWGLYIAIAWSALSLALAAALGPWVFGAAVLGVALAWAYSAPPLRLKRRPVSGPAAVGFSYEGLAWFTGAAVMSQALPDARVIALAALYSVGAYGIMVLNDFKAIAGDARTGVRTLPVALGPQAAARAACIAMAAPQAVVVALLFAWGQPIHAALVAASLAAQLGLMARLVKDPEAHAPWYNATGVTLYVLGMMASAVAVAPLA